MQHGIVSGAENSSAYEAHVIISHIVKTGEYLAGLADKTPQEILNRLLSSLVQMVSPAYGENFSRQVIDHPHIAEKLSCLPAYLGECEYALEKFWACKIARDESDYTCFPYLGNYVALVRAELAVLEKHIDLQQDRMCFIGSGPMPISAFEIKRQYPALTISCIDRENEALDLAHKVGELSGAKLQYIHAPAQQLDYADQAVIFIASMTTGKKELLRHIARTGQNGTLIGIRSTEGLRKILYKALDERDVPKEFKFLGKTEYKPEHVNTTLFYRLEKES